MSSIKKNNNYYMMRTSKKMCAIAENIKWVEKKVVSSADWKNSMIRLNEDKIKI